MSRTKREIVDEAYEELTLAGYTFDLTAEDVDRACQRLDSMIAGFEKTGVHLGYNFEGQADEESGIPMHAMEAVCCCLAQRLAMRIGKEVRAETARIAAEGWQRLLGEALRPKPAQPSLLPLGAANVYRMRPQPRPVISSLDEFDTQEKP